MIRNKIAAALSGLLLLLAFSRCSSQDPVLDAFRQATSVKIFSHTSSSDTLVYSSENKAEVARFIGYISGSGSEAYKCDYKGLMVLEFRDKPSVMLEFNTDENCGHIVYTSQDRIFYRNLTRDGLARLRKLVNE